jgi:hypothetical protein
MTKDEALMLAMEAMEITGGFDVEINAIKEALAQPEQEPVAWPVGWVDDGGTVFWKDKPPADGADLYTVIDKSAAVRIATSLGWEPKRTWVGLTDEEISSIAFKAGDEESAIHLAMNLLKEKNT